MRFMVLATAGLLAGSTTGFVSAQTVVDFESIAPGTAFGSSAGVAPGSSLFVENGVGVGIDNFVRNNSNGTTSVLFGDVTIGGFADFSFPTTPATLSNVRLTFDLSDIAPVNQASFEYADFGGRENLVVNGNAFDFDDFLDAPTSIDGVSITVSGTSDAGTVELSGPIASLAIGGQELGIDNITFIPEPSALGLLLTGLGLTIRRRRAAS